MAKIIQIKVAATDEGSIKKLIAQLRAAGIEVDKVSTAHRRAGAAADDHHSKLNKGAAGIGNSTKSFSKMASAIDGGNNSLVGAYAALAANIFAVTAAFLALKNAAETAQVIEGLAASGARVGLSYKNATMRVREAADGLLSLEQSARSSAQVLAAGFKPDQLIKLTNAAQDASYALGRDMAESMDRLTRGVIKLEPELLDELGIMVRIDEASAAYARTLGKSASQLTAAEKRQGFFAASMAEVNAKFGGLSDGANNSATSLNKLAATFSDLTKNMLNLLNFAFGPLVKMFGSSQGILLGGMMLFASSIKGQLLPVLTEASEKMQRMASKASKLSGTAAQGLLSSFNNANKFPSGLTLEYFERVKEGEGSLKETIGLQKKLNEAIATGRDPSGRFEDEESRGKRALVYKKELDALKQVEIAQLHGAEVQNLATATEIAARGNLVGAIKHVGTAVSQYNTRLLLASASTGVFATASRYASVSVFALSNSVKVLGIAILTWLPWLGLITIVLGGIYSILMKVAGEAYAKVIEATKAHNEVIKTASTSLEQYNKLVNSTASKFTITTERAKIASNSIIELATSLKALEESYKNNSGFGKFIEGFKNFFNIMRTEDIKGMVKKNQEAGGSLGYWAIENNYKLIKTFESMAKYESAGGIIKRVFGPEGPKTIEEYKKAVALLETKSKSLAATVEEVGAAFKALENSSADFIKAAVPTTVYDSMTTSLQAATLSMSKYVEEVGRGTQNSADLIATLSGIGPSTEQFLSVDASNTLTKYRDITSQIQEIKALGDQATSADTTRLASLNKELPALSSKGLMVLDELNAQRAIFENMQNQSLEQQGQLAIAQARLSVVGKSTAVTRAESDAKVRAENAVIALQISQLKSQASILESLIAQNTEKQKLIDKEKELVGLAGVSDDQSRLSYNNSRILALSSDKSQFAQQAIVGYTKQNELLRKNIELKISSARATAAINNLEGQQAALASQAITEGERVASGDIASAQTATTAAEKELQVLDAKLGVLKDAAALEELLYGYSLESAYIFEANTKKYEVRLKLIKEESKLRVAQLSLEAALSTTTANRKEFERRIKEEKEKILPALEAALKAEKELNYFKELGVLNVIQQNELALKALDIQLKQKEVLADRIISEAELAEVRTRGAAKLAGRDLTPTEERKLAFEMAEANLNAALAVQDIKESQIKAEYALINMQYQLEREKLRNSMSLMRSQLVLGLAAGSLSASDAESMTRTLEVQKKYIDALTSVIDGLGEQESAAFNILRDNIDKLKKAVKDTQMSGRLSGAYANPVASVTALDSENIGFNKETISALSEDLSPFLEQLKKLGPDGEYISSFVQGSLIMIDSISRIKDATEDLTAAQLAYYAAVQSGDASKIAAAGNDLHTASLLKISAQLQLVSSVIAQTQQVVAESSRQKTDGIDREIAAEQKRDGKSAESLAKIASFEKKKEAMARKAFEVNKKIMMAQAIMATAAGVAGALGSPPWGIPAIIMAGIVGAMGAAQIAIIAGTSYQSSSSSSSAVASPSSVSVGSRGNSVDLARNNVNAGGEAGYLTGAQGQGSSASNFTRRAYGGYGHAGMIVGEKGPELFVPSTPGHVTSNDNIQQSTPLNATFNISAIDAEGVEEVLMGQRGHIIGMLREAANANGQNFLENVNTAKYRRGGGRKL